MQPLEPPRPEFDQALPIRSEPDVALGVLANGANRVDKQPILLGIVFGRSGGGNDEEPVKFRTHPNLCAGVLVKGPDGPFQFGDWYPSQNGVLAAPKQFAVAGHDRRAVPCGTNPAKSVGYGLLQGRMDPAAAIPMAKETSLSEPDRPLRGHVSKIAASRNARRIRKGNRFLTFRPFYVAVEGGHRDDARPVGEGSNELRWRDVPLAQGGPAALFEEGYPPVGADPEAAGLIDVDIDDA